MNYSSVCKRVTVDEGGKKKWGWVGRRQVLYCAILYFLIFLTMCNCFF